MSFKLVMGFVLSYSFSVCCAQTNDSTSSKSFDIFFKTDKAIEKRIKQVTDSLNEVYSKQYSPTGTDRIKQHRDSLVNRLRIRNEEINRIIKKDSIKIFSYESD